MEACLKEVLPPPVELEESLRNGVLLAKLGHCFAPAVVPLKKIYDVEQLRYQVQRAGSAFYLLPLSLPFSLATRGSGEMGPEVPLPEASEQTCLPESTLQGLWALLP